jgi:SAM-dependent methyltransferase
VILDPSDQFVGARIGPLVPRYVKPNVSGVIPFPDDCFDLLTCFGVLHHIPNVSFVIQEMARVTRPAGYIIVREPVVSMGDWRVPRPGLTKRERGIPATLFRRAIEVAGLRVVKCTHCMFRPTMRVGFTAKRYNTRLGAAMDAWLSRLFAWNNVYHPTKAWHKFRPAAMSFVLTKQ